MLGDDAGGVGGGKAACGAAHALAPVRIGQNIGNGGTKTRGIKIGLGQTLAAACRFKLACVRGLVVIHGAGEGDHQGRPSRSGKFGDGRGTGAGDHKVGSRKPVRHIGEEDRHRRSHGAVASLHCSLQQLRRLERPRCRARPCAAAAQIGRVAFSPELWLLAGTFGAPPGARDGARAPSRRCSECHLSILRQLAPILRTFFCTVEALTLSISPSRPLAIDV